MNELDFEATAISSLRRAIWAQIKRYNAVYAIEAKRLSPWRDKHDILLFNEMVQAIWTREPRIDTPPLIVSMAMSRMVTAGFLLHYGFCAALQKQINKFGVDFTRYEVKIYAPEETEWTAHGLLGSARREITDAFLDMATWHLGMATRLSYEAEDQAMAEAVVSNARGTVMRLQSLDRLPWSDWSGIASQLADLLDAYPDLLADGLIRFLDER